MMLVFFFGIGATCLLVATTQNAWQLAAALTLLGAFASIYHPVGIPMLVQGMTLAQGAVIGSHGLARNLGIAAAAVLTGLTVKYFGWRMAFVVPGGDRHCLRHRLRTCASPRGKTRHRRDAPRCMVDLPPSVIARNAAGGHAGGDLRQPYLQFHHQWQRRAPAQANVARATRDPATLGALLAGVYAVASFAQLIVGRAIDRYPLKRLFLTIVLVQIPLFALAMHAQGWAFYALAIAFMAFVFGAIPFTDALIVRYVDDRMRSRVAGVRLAIAFGVSSLAVWLLGPLVEGQRIALFWPLAAIAAVSAVAVTLLPRCEQPRGNDGPLVPARTENSSPASFRRRRGRVDRAPRPR